MGDLTNVHKMKDAAGNILAVGDVVVYKGFARMYLGTIKHFSPKMVRVVSNKRNRRKGVDEKSVYPHDLAKPEGKNLGPVTDEGYCKDIINLTLNTAKSDEISSDVLYYNLNLALGVLGRGPKNQEKASLDAIITLKRSMPNHEKRWEQEDMVARIKGEKRGPC